MTKHTAGKWELVDHDAYPSMMEIKGASFRVVIIMGATDLTFEDSLKRKEDALKMAAAPELLEALVDSVKAMESYMVQVDGEWGMCRTLEDIERDGDLIPEIIKARAAIAKATGKTE